MNMKAYLSITQDFLVNFTEWFYNVLIRISIIFRKWRERWQENYIYVQRRSAILKISRTAAFSGKNEYLDWLTASNDYTILRPELFNSSGAFSSPTLTINGEYWDLKQLTLADTNMVDGFLKSIGLDADQVGMEGKMPSIGASGKPISVAS